MIIYRAVADATPNANRAFIVGRGEEVRHGEGLMADALPSASRTRGNLDACCVHQRSRHCRHSLTTRWRVHAIAFSLDTARAMRMHCITARARGATRKCCNHRAARQKSTTSNCGVACGRHTSNFQLHLPRKSGYLCVVAFRLARPSFELNRWNFGLTEKLVKGEMK